MDAQRECSESRSASARPVVAILLLTLLAFALGLGLQRTLSFDYGWHVMAGRWIAEQRAVPRIDSMSVAHQGARWIDSHWGFQVALYALHSLGGHAAVTLGKAGLVVLLSALTLLAGWRESRPSLAVAATATMLVAASPRLIVRPELASLALLAATLALWDRFERRGDKAVYGVVALQLLWVNLHGLFALGLAIAAAHAFAELARGVIGPGLRRDRLQRIATILVLATAVSLLNPNGLEAALLPIRQLGILTDAATGPSDGLMAELIRSLDPRLGLARLHTVVWLALAGASGLAMLAARSRLRPVDPLLWGAFAFLALEANRNVGLFAVVAAPILARYATVIVDTRPPPGWSRGVATVGLGCAIVLATVDVARDRFYSRVAYPRETGLGLQTYWYPEGAARFLARERPAGPVANAMRDGGHLLMELYPPQRVLVDGRFAGLGGEQRFEIRELADLERLDRQFQFGSLVVAYAALPLENLVRTLLAEGRRHPHRDAGWKLVHVDDVSLVFVHRSRSDLPELELPAPRAPLANRPAAARRQLLARSKLLASLDRPGAALDALDAARALVPVLDAPSLRRAELLLRARRLPETRAELAALLASTSEAWVATAAANLLLRSGDLRAAGAALARALELAPGYGPATERIEPVERALESERAGDLAAAREHQRAALAGARPTPAQAAPGRLRIWLEDACALGFGLLLALTAIRSAARRARARVARSRGSSGYADTR